MKYYLIAGEASGDLHGANLMAALKSLDGEAEFRCWGGDGMEKAGGILVKHYRDLAFMGFVEVLANLPAILKNISFCKSDLLLHRPDALILIDYPGFNLRIAKFAKQNGLKVFYYIAPQLWAWHKSRIKTLRNAVDGLYVILPFEERFFIENGLANTHFVGHPLLDMFGQPPEIGKEQALEVSRSGLRGQAPLVALLPGSRRQEITRILPIMLSVVPHFPQLRFAVGCAPAIPPELYGSLLRQSGAGNVELVCNQTHRLLRKASAALVTSGTATLEAALHNVPQVVCYKGNELSYQIAKRVVRVPYISLVNLILQKKAVAELIQSGLNTGRLCRELEKILPDTPHRAAIMTDYGALRLSLGKGGAAIQTARHVLDGLLKNLPAT